MSKRLQAAAVALLLLLPAATSCRKRRPLPKPFQLPAQTEAARPAPPPSLEPPPEIPVNEPVAVRIPAEEPQPLAAPPAPPKKRPPAAGSPAPAAAEPAVTPPAAPAPQLRPMLSAAQRQELERSINERIRRTQGILASLASKTLSGEVNELVQQIRTFLKQAEEAREGDLLRANNLAERAEVLAQDLAKRLR